MLLVSINIFCFGQEKTNTSKDLEDNKATPIFSFPPIIDENYYCDIIEEAEFTEGNFNRYVGQCFDLDKKTKEKVALRFVVEEDGSISDIKVISKNLANRLDENCIEAIKKTNGKWKPATINGEPAKTYLTVVISVPEDPIQSPE